MNPPAQRPITYHPILTLSVCLISAEAHTALSRKPWKSQTVFVWLYDFCSSVVVTLICSATAVLLLVWCLALRQRTWMTGYWIRRACRHELDLHTHTYTGVRHAPTSYLKGPPEATRLVWCLWQDKTWAQILKKNIVIHHIRYGQFLIREQGDLSENLKHSNISNIHAFLINRKKQLWNQRICRRFDSIGLTKFKPLTAF